MKKIINKNTYCNSLSSYSRWKTREVKIGDIPLGANNPIRIQSMTTTDTMDTKKTVEQSIRMIDAGCEYVRVTAPGIKEAKNLANIKKELQKRGYNTPLIADIHFTPNAAQVAAKIIEKVRINPGNYADRKKFNYIEFEESPGCNWSVAALYCLMTGLPSYFPFDPNRIFQGVTKSNLIKKVSFNNPKIAIAMKVSHTSSEEVKLIWEKKKKLLKSLKQQLSQ